jgi:hypothetical protein
VFHPGLDIFEIPDEADQADLGQRDRDESTFGVQKLEGVRAQAFGEL